MISDKIIIVTGGAGFIGSNLVEHLNRLGYINIIIIDSLNYGVSKDNLEKLKYVKLLDYKNGLDYLKNTMSDLKVEVVFHIGANADVLQSNIDEMIDSNFNHSRFWFNLSKKQECPFIYASSSAVYGNSTDFYAQPEYEDPHNEYAFSKLVFDNYVRFRLRKETIPNKVIGFRFFNTFGIGEDHKGRNSSIPYRFFKFIIDDGKIDLFDTEIKRDYVYVNDLVKVLVESWKNKIPSGIYNLGNGHPVSHEHVADLVVDTMIEVGVISGDRKQYLNKIKMPKNLIDKFQYLTRADDLRNWIATITRDNKEKMKQYITTLSKRYHDSKK